MHAIVWRQGRPVVVTYSISGIDEVAAEPYEDEQRAIARLAMLSRWDRRRKAYG